MSAPVIQSSCVTVFEPEFVTQIERPSKTIPAGAVSTAYVLMASPFWLKRDTLFAPWFVTLMCEPSKQRDLDCAPTGNDPST